MSKKNKIENENKEKKVNPYKLGFLNRVPYSLKALVVKYWFQGALCFFFGFGLGLQSYWFALIGGIAYGVCMDLIIKNLFLMMDSDKKESKYHCFCTSKQIYSLFINLFLSVGLFYLSIFLISLLHSVNEDSLFGNEPFSFALITSVLEILILLIKYSILTIYQKIKPRKE